MSSDKIDIIWQRLSMVFLGAIVGGALRSVNDMFFSLAMMVFLIALLVLILVYVNLREKELAPPNKHLQPTAQIADVEDQEQS